ncbi:hypothetical protein RJ639_011458 [Escallonia herrerae]|uniref:starch synthase n=1 Tax=Escallonia herrerae TaxID=1293975 RepID=A0AA88VPW6_9ASTE|nr:hypothetical protein RJ639_011458 [Escallonia herrerae]
MAIEELEEMKKEEKSLLDRIEQLEVKMQAKTGKDKPLISLELLLRIDTMVLTGMIGTSEACDLRKLVMEFYGLLKGLHIVHICTEMAPVASEGSLAAYVTGLSHALQREGNLLEVILPNPLSLMVCLVIMHNKQTPLKLGALTLSLASAFKTLFELRLTVIHTSCSYSSLNLDDVQGLRKSTQKFFHTSMVKCMETEFGLVLCVALESHLYSLFTTPFSAVRRYMDTLTISNGQFTYFSRASLDYLVKSGKQPDVIHIHNWETSIVGPRFWDVFVNQCLEQPDKLALCGLDPSSLHRPDRLQDNNKAQLVNILKGGVVYSNKVILVTSTHLEGPLFRSSNNGLEPTLAIHKDKLLIVPSGVDNSMGDPSGNILPVQSYSSDEINNNPSKWNRTRMDATKKVSPWDEQHYDLHVSAYLSVANL